MLVLDTRPGDNRKKKKFFFDKRWIQGKLLRKPGRRKLGDLKSLELLGRSRAVE